MINIRNTVPALLAAVLAFAFVATPTVRAADDETPLAKAMDEMGDHYKAIKKIIKDPSKNAETLALIDKSLAAALISKVSIPTVIEKAPEAEKAKMIVGYRKMMYRVIATYIKLENEILDNNNEAAADTLKALHDLEEEGHEVYNP